MENYIWPEITKETPLEEIKRIHQQIWDYVIEHGQKPKTPYLSDCALCEYSNSHESDNDPTCSKCPVGGGNLLFECLNGLYSEWLIEIDDEKANKIAKQIRDLKFKF